MSASRRKRPDGSRGREVTTKPRPWAEILSAAAGFCCCFTLLPCGTAAAPGEESSSVLLSESFENPRLLERGWYDGAKFTISDTRAFAGQGCVEYAWKAGATTPANSSGIRRLFAPADTVYLRCAVAAMIASLAAPVCGTATASTPVSLNSAARSK